MSQLTKEQIEIIAGLAFDRAMIDLRGLESKEEWAVHWSMPNVRSFQGYVFRKSTLHGTQDQIKNVCYKLYSIALVDVVYQAKINSQILERIHSFQKIQSVKWVLCEYERISMLRGIKAIA